MKVFAPPSKTIDSHTNSTLQRVDSSLKTIVNNRPSALAQTSLQRKINDSAIIQKKQLYANSLLNKQVVQLMPSRNKKKKDDDDDGEYVPPQGKKQKRYSVPKNVTEQIIRATAHKRRNVNKAFDAIFTCRRCRRPLAFIRKGEKTLRLARYRYLSSKRKKRHDIRALALDHYPRWAERERALKSRGASDAEIRADHNDPTRLRAICKKCNEKHNLEFKKVKDYDSDDDEEGFDPPSDEPENKDVYKDFRFDPSGGGAAAMAH